MNPDEMKKVPRRGIYILPSLLTTGNIFCGFYAIVVILFRFQNDQAMAALDSAAIAIGIAVVLDGLDGRIARMTGTCSQFGLQLDSLADAISFGMAPAVVLCEWHRLTGMRLGYWGLIAAFLFMVCGVMRLARFNIQAPGSKHFMGVPIPAAAGCVAALAHFAAKTPYTNWPIFQPGPVSWLLLGLSLVLGALMISTLRFGSLKSVAFKRKTSFFILPLLALLVTGIYFYSQELLMVIAYGYLLSGLLGGLQRRLFPQGAAHPHHEEAEETADPS